MSAAKLPTCALNFDGEELWTESQVLKVQQAAFEAGALNNPRFDINEFCGLYDFLKARAAKPDGIYDRMYIGWAHAVRKLYDIATPSAAVSARTADLIAIVARLAALVDGLNNGNSSTEHEACKLAEQAKALVEKATGGA